MRCTRPRGGPWVLLLALLLAACGREAGAPPPAPRVVVATQVPTGSYDARPEPDARYPTGSRLVRFDLARPDVAPVVLTEGMAAAGGAVPTIDGKRILFTGKEDAEAPYGIWSCRPDGSDRRLLVSGNHDCCSPAELPDGRIVHARALAGPSVSEITRARWALFVQEPETPKGKRITFGGGVDVDPTVLRDGRVLYASWQRSAAGGDGGLYLWTIHPDGTGAARLSHADTAEGHRAVLPRQALDGRLLYVDAEPGDAVELDMRDGYAASLFWHDDEAGTASIECAPDGLVTVCGVRGAVRVIGVGAFDTWGLFSVPLSGEGDAHDTVHLVRIAARQRPQGHLSSLRRGYTRGDLLCLDARPPEHGHAARIRVIVLPPSYAGDPRKAGQMLGEVPLAADGSFFVSLPADTPFLLDLLDARGSVLTRGVTPLWVRPNETRACVGCHDDPDTAPPNRRPLAIDHDPFLLMGYGGEGWDR
jgi:hypothetical protein